MAKNWFDGPIPTPEIGILGGLPSLQLTEEDKRRAWAQMFLQGGLATAAASLGGANTGRALGAGLLGGADAYGQGLQAPAARMDAYSKQLKMQGDQIGNAKGMEELAKLKRDASDYANKNDFLAMLNDPGRAAMLYGGGPSVQNEQRASQFGANPAMLLSDPRMNLKALQAGVDPKQLGAALENTRPYEQKPGMFYNGQYLPDPTKGVGMVNGEVTALPGFEQTQNKINYAGKAGELAAQLAYDRAKLPYDVSRAGQVAAAETAAKDPYQFQQIQGPNGKPVFMTNPQARNQAQGNQFPGYRVPPDVQAQRDNVAQGIYNQESAGQFSPRLNDKPGAGQAPQLVGIQGQSPADRKQQELIKGALVDNVFVPAYKKAADASSMLPLIDRQLSNIDAGKLNGGRLEPIKNDARAWLQGLGLSSAEQESALNSAVEFRQYAVRKTLASPRAEGPQSDRDMQLYQDQQAKLTDPTAAIRQSLTFDRAQNQRLIEYRKFMDAHLQAGKPLETVQAEWEQGPGAKSIWEDQRLRQYLPTVRAQSGPYKGREMIQLPDGRFMLK